MKLMNEFDPAALRCLAALADERGFERAAQRLSITQSAVSQRLRALEAQVGQPLVVRSRPLRLTEAGKVLLRFARQLQALRVDVARELGERVAPQSRLAIAVNADSLATWWAGAVGPFCAAQSLLLELVVEDQDVGLRRMKAGEVAACLCGSERPVAGARCLPLGAMRYRAVASPAAAPRACAASSKTSMTRRPRPCRCSGSSMMTDDPPKQPPPPAPADGRAQAGRPACPVCGGGLVERRGKLICSRCRTICETCCEGGRG